MSSKFSKQAAAAAAFHTHPIKEKDLGVDKRHVIVDRDFYELVVFYLNSKGVTTDELLNQQVDIKPLKIDREYLALLRAQSPEEFEKLYQGEPQPHDVHACTALKEYDEACNVYDNEVFGLAKEQIRVMKQRGTLIAPNMFYYAEKYGVTVKQMKDHWGCIKTSDNNKR